MSDPITRMDDWLVDHLTTDNTLMALLATDAEHAGVYVAEITPPAIYPAVVIQALSVLDIVALGPKRIGANAVYLIKAVGQTRSFQALQAIMDRVDTLLQSSGGQLQAGTIVMVNREQTISYGETDAAERPFRHLGARYRCYAPA